jgi:prefoldin subunit 5
MAKKTTLKSVSVSVGTALGKADKKAHQLVKAGAIAKEELQTLSKQVDELKKQLAKTTKRLRKAIS